MSVAHFEKRGKKTRASIRRVGYEPESKTFATRRDAEMWAAERELELMGGPAPKLIQNKRTVSALLVEYKTRVTPFKRGCANEVVRIDRMECTLPWASRLAAEVTSQDISAWRDKLRTMECEWTGKRYSAATVLRYYGMLRTIFRRAVVEWKWFKSSPFDGVENPQPAKPRTQRWSNTELAQFCLAAGYRHGAVPKSNNQRVATALLLAIETGMRRGEILALTRAMVDLDARVIRLPGEWEHMGPRAGTKTLESRDIPLSLTAVELLSLLLQGMQSIAPTARLIEDTCYGFCTRFTRLARRAELRGKHFHDSRREALTRLAAQSWCDAMTLAKISGHKDLKVLLKTYYAPDMSEIAKRMDVTQPKRARA